MLANLNFERALSELQARDKTHILLDGGRCKFEKELVILGLLVRKQDNSKISAASICRFSENSDFQCVKRTFVACFQEDRFRYIIDFDSAGGFALQRTNVRMPVKCGSNLPSVQWFCKPRGTQEGVDSLGLTDHGIFYR